MYIHQNQLKSTSRYGSKKMSFTKKRLTKWETPQTLYGTHSQTNGNDKPLGCL